jgi:Mitochondrial K+-H+ exchange-related
MSLLILAIIPNLPFFFCVWRSWSHYRGIFSRDHLGLLLSYRISVIAYKASQYLQSLLDHDLIIPEANESLDEVYKLHPPSSNPNSVSESSESSGSSAPQEPHRLLLAPEAVPAILSLFEFESTTASADLHRAIEQARSRVASGRADL